MAKDEITFVKVSFFLLAIIFFYALIGYSSINSLELIVYFNWIMAGVIAVYTMRLFSGHELNTIYYVLFISLLILMFVYTIEGAEIRAVGDALEAKDVAQAWYGSLLMLFSGLSLIVVLNVKKKLLQVISLLIIFMALYINVFVLQRGTNVIMTMAEMAMILVFLFKKKSVVITISVIFAILLGFAFFSDNLIRFCDWLAQVSPSDRLSYRFNQIALALMYEDMEASSGSMGARSELMNNSWNTFTSSFSSLLFGAGEHTASNEIVGHHSFILDTLANYGLIGGTLIYVYFKKQYHIIMSYLDQKREWALFMQCAVVFLFYVLRNFYGVFSFALVNFVILMFFPLTFQLIRHYSTNK